MPKITTFDIKSRVLLNDRNITTLDVGHFCPIKQLLRNYELTHTLIA